MDLKIKLEDYNHQCADRCCDTWGVDISINDEYVDSVEMAYSAEIEMSLKVVLEHLGHKVEIETE